MALPRKNKLLCFFIILLLAIILCGCSLRTSNGNYTIKYDSMGGTIYSQYKGSEVFTMLIPRKDGYTFEGWYLEKDFSGERLSFPYILKENITVYANYIDNNVGNLELVYNLLDDGYEVTEYKGTSFVIYIPENHNGLPVTRLCENFIKNIYYTTIIYIGKNVNEIKERLYINRRLGAIEVNGNNETFSSQDGILYDKNRTTLICYPAGRLGNDFTLPEETEIIATNALRKNIFLQNITLNKVVDTIDKGILDLINLRTVSVPIENLSFCSVDSVLFNKDKTVLIHFPARHEQRHYVMPDTVIEVAESAFAFGVLETLTIGSKVSKMSEIESFKYLTKINVASGNPNFASLDGVLFDNAGETLLKVPSRMEVSGGNYDYALPASVKEISSFAFEGVVNIKKLFINQKLVVIDSYAFSGECAVEEITFQQESKLETIEAGAFSGCNNLTLLNITSRTPPNIDEEELDKCVGLKIVVPENMRGLYEVLWSNHIDKLKNGQTLQNYKATFDSRGGSFVGNVTAGFIITEPIPSNGSHNFLGWYSNIEGTGSKYTFPMAIHSNITLYAAWG